MLPRLDPFVHTFAALAPDNTEALDQIFNILGAVIPIGNAFVWGAGKPKSALVIVESAD